MDVLFYTLSHNESAKHKFRAIRAKSYLHMKKIIFFAGRVMNRFGAESKLFELIRFVCNMYCGGNVSIPDKSIW